MSFPACALRALTPSRSDRHDRAIAVSSLTIEYERAASRWVTRSFLLIESFLNQPSHHSRRVVATEPVASSPQAGSPSMAVANT